MVLFKHFYFIIKKTIIPIDPESEKSTKINHKKIIKSCIEKLILVTKSLSVKLHYENEEIPVLHWHYM